MYEALQILTLVAVALAMALSVAHALEMLVKMHLEHGEPMAVQHVYYRGFAIGGGISEGGGLFLTLLLLLDTPAHTTAFWLTLCAFILLLGIQAVYWFSIHRINQFWLKGQALGAAGVRLFGIHAVGKAAVEAGTRNWKRLRNRWEYSHLARAGLAVFSFLSLLLALASSR